MRLAGKGLVSIRIFADRGGEGVNKTKLCGRRIWKPPCLIRPFKALHSDGDDDWRKPFLLPSPAAATATEEIIVIAAAAMTPNIPAKERNGNDDKWGSKRRERCRIPHGIQSWFS